ncbi:MAG: helix-turn-helix transcriptional regulator [Anaerolineaceae bacterium]|nr:helix-turn-helix transcriptional regulator [Anaerolineaceae bacterium]
MIGDLLQTKLYVPRLRPSLIPRSHLVARLNQGVLHGSKLTLISAPAGFGKTTLVSEWIAGGERPFAWLSLDERDSDLSRFLTYLIAALQTVAATIGKRAQEQLHSPQPPPTETLLTNLLNEIAAFPDEFSLVLDDYHVVESQPVDEALTFLLEHLPPQMHLVMTTREDPQLPLPRLRVRGQLTELRAADLRFTMEETAVFLNQIMNLNLSADDVAALETRTEGWIAGLQLAAIAIQSPLSMQGRADGHGFIEAFAGDNRYVVDYLVDEVLQRQTEQVHDFLLQTAILDQLSGPLCDAVTGQAESSTLLETLERGNLFVIPLDDRRHWYRYHHLFADVLQAHLLKEQPDQVPVLHQRASRWHEENGSLADAVSHAFAAGDLERVADLAELSWPAMDRNRESNIWLGWVQALPDELVRTRPVLSAGCAWALLDQGKLEAAEANLQTAERWLEPEHDTPVFADEAQFQALPATIASARTYLALALGDMQDTVTYGRRALNLIPKEDYHQRATPAALLGLATWASGNLEEAYQSFSEAMSSYQKAGNVMFAITGTYILADIRLAQGRLREAIKVYEQALQLAQDQGEPAMRGTADLHLGLSDLYREQGDLAAAAQQLQNSEELSEQAALPRWQERYCLTQARIKEAAGDLAGALALLEEAERLYIRGPVPDVRPIAALKARVWTAQGNLAAALAWADEQGLSANNDLNYLREFEHITLVRIRLAQYRQDREKQCLAEAVNLLSRLQQAAEAGGRHGSAIEIFLQQALAHAAQDDIPQALTFLERALTLAEPEGYVRIFVSQGQPIAKLLAETAVQEIAPSYVRKLLAAFAAEEPATASPQTVAAEQPLVEPLSERELEVLQLVAEGLSNREIAERLFLALSTVKGHNRVIYGKLSVSRRTEAVARARELGLL